MNTKQIILTSDNNYVLPTKSTIKSIVRNSKEKININIIAVEISEENKKILNSFATNNISITLIEKKNEFSELGPMHRHVSKADLFKFKFPSIFSDYDKVLYIDGDIIVNEGFEEIFNFNIDDYYGAVVQDMIAVVEDKWNEKFNHAKYFNAGMMYLNLKKMREDNISEKLIEYKKNDPDTHFMSQSALNAVIGDKMLYLPPKFNFLTTYTVKYDKSTVAKFYEISDEEVEKTYAKPYFYHFTDKNKVWKSINAPKFEDWIPYADSELFAKILKDSILECQREIEELRQKIDYYQHRTLFGAISYLAKKIRGKK